MAKVIRLAILVPALLLSATLQVKAQKADPPNARMASFDQYLMADRNAEIALARTAAPKSISDNAEVMVLEREGYSTAVKGTNGFVCMVERSWTAGPTAPEFWNSKVRSPICFNPPAARSYLPMTITKAKLALAGKSQDQIFEAIDAALDKKELPALEVGAMSYMMSKEAHLSDQVGRWHPHVMFFLPHMDGDGWGANLPGSPIFSGLEIRNRMDVLFVPVPEWSDGTTDSRN